MPLPWPQRSTTRASILISPLPNMCVHNAGVKLGKVTPKVWEDLESQGLSEQELEDAAAEAAAAAAAEEQEELKRLKAAELAREALNRVRGFGFIFMD